MNEEEKKVFIEDLITNVKKEIIKNVSKMPDNWNGTELRWYIKDHFKDVISGKHDRRSKQYRDYFNSYIMNGL